MEWWKKGVIYQIYPRSFAAAKTKSNGDLKGITSKLDYLQQLGVDAIWISPFYKSPMKDFGYDVADYKDVDPTFGNIGDFDKLITMAKKRNLRVIIDHVFNHSSDQHSWFQSSKESKSGSKSDWYVWADPKKDGCPPNNWLSVFGGPAWTWNSQRRQYYLHQFLKEQPDLNFNNPKVIKALLEIAKFWFKKGVAGFRLDTVNFYTQDTKLRDNPELTNRDASAPHSDLNNPYFYQKHLYDRPYKKNLDFLAKLREVANKYKDTMLMGEIGDSEPLPILEEYTKSDKHLHTAYTFVLLEQAITPQRVASVFQKLQKSKGWPCFAFSNHDVVRSLSRVVDKEIYYEPCAKMLLTLLCSLRGTPCLYQGEELGLPEAEVSFNELQDPYGKTMWPRFKGRDGCRTPMPWDSKLKYAGFSKQKPWLPINDIHTKKAVKQQLVDKNSVLKFTQKFLQWRKTQPNLYGAAALEIEKADNNLLVFVRKEKNQTIRAAFNFSNKTNLCKSSGEVLFSSANNCNYSKGTVKLPAYSSCFLKIL